MSRPIVFACLDNLSYFIEPADGILADSGDVELVGCSEWGPNGMYCVPRPDGVYRRVDPILMKWLTGRIGLAVGKVDSAEFNKAADFLRSLVAATGIDIDEMADATIPFNYQRPRAPVLPNFDETFLPIFGPWPASRKQDLTIA